MKPNLNRYEDPLTAEVYDCQIAADWADRDLEFYKSLAKECPGPALELACGTGRVLIPLAREGVDVTGLDISQNMLSVARRKVDKECPHVQRRITLVKGDMTSFDLGCQFGLILVPFRAFQVLLERADQKSCLCTCARHLTDEGRLVFNVFNPRPSRLAQADGVDEQPRDFAGPYGLNIRWSGLTKYDTGSQRLNSAIRYESTSRTGGTKVHDQALELRYFFRYEVEWMLEACGFEVEALYGDFDRSPFGSGSPEMIFVAKKKPTTA